MGRMTEDYMDGFNDGDEDQDVGYNDWMVVSSESVK
jgi:hypothetical protein